MKQNYGQMIKQCPSVQNVILRNRCPYWKSLFERNSQISEFLLFLQTVKTMNVSFEDVELDEIHYGQR